MKRKKAISFNAPGGTKNYIGVGCRNLIDNGCYPAPVSCNNGVGVIGGYDYSYTVFGGVPSRAYRKNFDPLDYHILEDNDLWDSIFLIGRCFYDGCTMRVAIFFFGWRIVIEYFDVNAIVDFTNEIEPGMSLDKAIERFIKIYSCYFSVKILNEHLLNITAL